MQIGCVCGILAVAEAETIITISGRVAVGWSGAKRRVDVATARARAVTSQDRESDESSAEDGVEAGEKYGEELLTAAAAHDWYLEECP